MTPEDRRFWRKVRRTETCWLWTGALRDGYGLFWRRGRMEAAHRVSFESVGGIIPQGLVLDHLCRVRRCVRPEHLEPVSNRVNVLRGEGLSAQNAQRTACPIGHLLDAGNTYLRPSGKRECRTCKRSQAAASARRCRNSELPFGDQPKGVSRPSRGADGLEGQPLETQATVGVDVPAHEGAAGVGPAVPHALDELPDVCQQFACNRAAETWCPLCRAFFCAEHDELYPVRKHDCLRGKADTA